MKKSIIFVLVFYCFHFFFAENSLSNLDDIYLPKDSLAYKLKNQRLLPFRDRIELVIANDKNFTNKENELIKATLDGKLFSKIERENIIKNKDKTYSELTISFFLSIILERDIYSAEDIDLVNFYVSKYKRTPHIMGLYLSYKNSLQDFAPSWWLEPYMLLLANYLLERTPEDLLYNRHGMVTMVSDIIMWVAKNKKIKEYSLFILNLPFEQNFMFTCLDLHMKREDHKKRLRIKETENYDSLFDWYYEKVIVPAKLELEWFEKLKEKEEQIKLALKSKEKFLKKEKEMFLEKQNEILKLRENKK